MGRGRSAGHPGGVHGLLRPLHRTARPAPYCLILVKLDGADTALNHLLAEVELEDVERMNEAVRIGMRVEAVWLEQREGGIQDIKHSVLWNRAPSLPITPISPG